MKGDLEDRTRVTKENLEGAHEEEFLSAKHQAMTFVLLNEILSNQLAIMERLWRLDHD